MIVLLLEPVELKEKNLRPSPTELDSVINTIPYMIHMYFKIYEALILKTT